MKIDDFSVYFLNLYVLCCVFFFLLIFLLRCNNLYLASPFRHTSRLTITGRSFETARASSSLPSSLSRNVRTADCDSLSFAFESFLFFYFFFRIALWKLCIVACSILLAEYFKITLDSEEAVFSFFRNVFLRNFLFYRKKIILNNFLVLCIC